MTKEKLIFKPQQPGLITIPTSSIKQSITPMEANLLKASNPSQALSPHLPLTLLL